MSIKELREEVASALLEKIKKVSEDANYQDPESLKVLGQAYAAIVEVAPRRSSNAGGTFVG